MRWLCLPLLLLALSACEPTPEPVSPPPATAEDQAADSAALAAATTAFWTAQAGQLAQAAREAEQLCTLAETLLAGPSEEALAAARAQWQRGHQAWLGGAALLHLGQVQPALFGELTRLRAAVDLYPIMPGYIDAWGEYSHSGIVNDITVPLTASALREQHGLTSADDVALGFHPIAYLLWGEDGARPATDFAEQPPGELAYAEQPNNRRRTYLQLACTLLAEDLAALAALTGAEGPLDRQYHNLLPATRARLLTEAAFTLVEQSLLSRQLTALTAGDLDAGLHNRYAGGEAAAWRAQLNALHTGLLDPETGLGQAWPLLPQANLLAGFDRALGALEGELTAADWQDAERLANLEAGLVEISAALAQALPAEPMPE